MDSTSYQHDCSTKTTTKPTAYLSDNQQANTKNRIIYEADPIDLRRAIMMEKLNEKRQAKTDHHKECAPETNSASSVLFSSTASSSPSESSSGGDNSSSSETDFSSSCFTPRPRRIRTSLKTNRSDNCHHFEQQTPPTKHENRFTTTKSRALKIYGELKRLQQQPNSPGARITSFLNSIFPSKKQSAAVSDHRSNTSTQSSACSSASSFSRSCLHKQPSSSNTIKKSVRFDDEEAPPPPRRRPSDRKQIPNLDSANHNPKSVAMQRDTVPATSKSWRSEEEEVDMAIRMMMMRGAWPRKTTRDGGGEVEDDAKSYASSELFELENVGNVGIVRYGEELPVYGTTKLPTTR